jgi:ribosomal protein L13
VKTTTLKKSEFKKEWHLLDATDISVGRLAARVCLILKGKN